MAAIEREEWQRELLASTMGAAVLMWRRRLRRYRMLLAAWIMGDGWHGVIMRLWLVHERAKAAITPEGSVILADCPALAEALYEPMPGTWSLTVSYIAPSRPSQEPGE